ncbi:hypothetical protein [Hydrogenophaga sp. 2FB]|uniref:hypothetical protein n=1 Tax=Hydrogenophaga sp. 2FB TaxID=2502187 RepID=UPI0010F5FAFD|nr:hypothetical protein [Hydrogenophaga sp. 2FB]
MTKLELNSRMPYMLMNWAEHDTRTARLSLEERGMFDVARSALWRVAGCKMPLDALKLRLRVAAASPQEALLDTLVALDLLTVDGTGWVYDDVQVREFEAAVQKAETNRENGRRGGRPKRQEPSPSQPSAPAREVDRADF